MIKITGLSIPLDYDMQTLTQLAAKSLSVASGCIAQVTIAKCAVNARDKSDIHFDMALNVSVTADEDAVLSRCHDERISKEMRMVYLVPKQKKLAARPVVVGCGPAGLFAALTLARAGAEPILLERGLDVDSRKSSVSRFWQTGALDPDTNVQFGEGGAGAFSDGKLKIGRMDYCKHWILSEFIAAGAPGEILYDVYPHIGTDRLSQAVKAVRQKIIRLGGEVRFHTTVTDILQRNGQVTGVKYCTLGEPGELATGNVILAIGHSARDTFAGLYAAGVVMEQRPIAVGVRVEHRQRLIDSIQYGHFAGNPALGAADYHMVVHLGDSRNVYTFCMCPGGSVVAASSEAGCLVTNGMSRYARDGENANAALLVTVGRADIGSDHPLAAIEYQRRIEQAAYQAGGGGFRAPVQRLDDFLKKQSSSAFGKVLPTYRPGTVFAPVDVYLPGAVADALRRGIKEFDDWMPGFACPDALLTGAETRSSSPVRITRGDSMEAAGIRGLYPCGEGAGYAGGIISAAVDGVKCAERILSSATD